jgi:hypothetical protein
MNTAIYAQTIELWRNSNYPVVQSMAYGLMHEFSIATDSLLLFNSFEAKGAELIQHQDLPDGMYAFRVRNADDKILSEEKLIIQKR